MAHEFSRKSLYDLVWSEPRVQLAKRLGVSDVAVGKYCRAADIPVPPRGYWARLEAGQSVSKIPLPIRGLGEADRIVIGGSRHYWYANEPISELPNPPSFDESIESVIKRAKAMVGKVKVPRSLESPHHLIVKLLDRDNELRKVYADHRFPWNEPRFDAPAPKRRLRLINAIFLALHRAGCAPSFSGKDAEELGCRVGDQWVSFIIEPTKKARVRDALFDAGNNGRQQTLRLVIKAHASCPEGINHEWVDTEKEPLEVVVPDVVLNIVVFGELNHRASLQSHYEWLVERKAAQEEKIRQEKELAEQQAREARLRKEEERREHLFRLASNWRLAGHIREFVAAMSHHPEADKRAEELKQWSAWALSEAEALDPLHAPILTIAANTSKRD
jgi:hypothetical protein